MALGPQQPQVCLLPKALYSMRTDLHSLDTNLTPSLQELRTLAPQTGKRMVFGIRVLKQSGTWAFWDSLLLHVASGSCITCSLWKSERSECLHGFQTSQANSPAAPKPKLRIEGALRGSTRSNLVWIPIGLTAFPEVPSTTAMRTLGEECLVTWFLSNQVSPFLQAALAAYSAARKVHEAGF